MDELARIDALLSRLRTMADQLELIAAENENGAAELRRQIVDLEKRRAQIAPAAKQKEA
jgi:hypothetical protein